MHRPIRLCRSLIGYWNQALWSSTPQLLTKKQENCPSLCKSIWRKLSVTVASWSILTVVDTVKNMAQTITRHLSHRFIICTYMLCIQTLPRTVVTPTKLHLGSSWSGKWLYQGHDEDFWRADSKGLVDTGSNQRRLHSEATSGQLPCPCWGWRSARHVWWWIVAIHRWPQCHSCSGKKR